jgi:hypothetical protein
MVASMFYERVRTALTVILPGRVNHTGKSSPGVQLMYWSMSGSCSQGNSRPPDGFPPRPPPRALAIGLVRRGWRCVLVAVGDNLGRDFKTAWCGWSSYGVRGCVNDVESEGSLGDSKFRGCPTFPAPPDRWI